MPLQNNTVFNPEFAPILLPGQLARLMKADGTHRDIEVLGVFSLGVHRHDFGSISSASVDQDCDHLTMPDGELGQWRFAVRSNMRVGVQNPSGVDIMRTNESVRGGQTSGMFIDPMLDDTHELEAIRETVWTQSEFFVLQDQRPRFDLYPLSSGAMEAHIDFYGYGFALRPTQQKPPVTIWVNGRPRGAQKI